jgi:hypothetical protein
MSALNFDANTVQPKTDFAALPAGDYLVMITDSEMKPTKTGRGQYLELSLQVIDGPMTNRLLWDRLTLVHDNAKTVEIAQRQLSAICHAVGVLQVTDSAQLHNIPLKVRVKYIEDQQYGPKNEIGGYKPANAPSGQPAQSAPAATQAPAWKTAPAQAAAPQQHAAPPPSKPAATTPPWARA